MKTFLAIAGATAALTGVALAQNQGGFGQPAQTQQAGAGQLTFYSLQPNTDLRVSRLIDEDVYNNNNEDIGEIEDLVMDTSKNIKAFVIGVGGFLGLTDRAVAVTPGSVDITRQNDGGIRVVVNATKEQLRNAPEVKLDELDRRRTAPTTGAGQSGGSNSDARDRANEGQRR
jgi:sporulation protein YlmC with PRC-barrel domain